MIQLDFDSFGHRRIEKNHRVGSGILYLFFLFFCLQNLQENYIGPKKWKILTFPPIENVFCVIIIMIRARSIAEYTSEPSSFIIPRVN